MTLVRHSSYREITSTGGLVTASDQRIADAGAAALEAGGNAVDAAVAAAFATGVVEPPMSGIGGGTTISIALRDPDRLIAVSGHVRVPAAATPDQYPLSDEPGSGFAFAFADFPVVRGHVNIYGPKSIAVPGTVAALCTAQERFGRLRREQVLAPAVALAADGFEINWFVAGFMASEARSLARDPGCTELFLPGGLPLPPPGPRPGGKLAQPKLAATLEAIAANGADVFYRGPVGESIVRYVQDLGGLLRMEDLASYEADVFDPPLVAGFGPYTMASEPVSGFPTVLESLYLYDGLVRSGAGREGDAPHDDAVAWARALRLAFADRFRYMSRDASVSVPWEGLRSRDYARARLEADRAGTPPPDPWAFTSEMPAAGSAGGGRGGSGFTSHMAAVDGDGSVVALTQTVLNAFGSRVLDPETGVLLNDGIGYFDPRPDAANGIKPGATAFSAMTPVVLCDERGPAAALGASGGRRIIAGVAQMIAALATGRVSLQRACEGPFIHAESDVAVLDTRWPPGTAEALEAEGFKVDRAEETPMIGHFARPNGVMIGSDGIRRSGVDPNKPGGAAAT